MRNVILCGDVRERLADLEDESVHCVVTSPPYWNLRDYGTATWTGGDEGCDHEPNRQSPSSTLLGGKATQGMARVMHSPCTKCGAVRIDSQLGLEATPDCGRPLMELRPDLSASQVALLRQSFADAGLLDAFPNGMDGTALLRLVDRSDHQGARPTIADDEPEAALHVSRNQGNANRLAEERLDGTPDIEASCNPSLVLSNAHPSSSDGSALQGEGDYQAGGFLPDAHQRQSPGDAAPLTDGPQAQPKSSAASLTMADPTSSPSLGGLGKSLPSHQDALPRSDAGSSMSPDSDSSRSEGPDRDTTENTVCRFETLLWAQYILPRNVLAFYQTHLCGECYVCHMVEVFRDVRRVLRGDGVMFLNLGDSYASTPPGNTTKGVSAASTLHGVNGASGQYRETLAASVQTKRSTIAGGLKPKDMVGIPWRVALALQADGWWLRSDIIWSKPNPMPESVTDRPTKSHEYLFLLSKSSTYYYDAEAIREPYSPSTIQRVSQPNFDNQHGGEKDYGPYSNRSARKSLENLKQNMVGKRGYVGFNDRWDETEANGSIPSGRNRRTVWEIATEPYAEAHFATFPTELVKPCIQAGTSEHGCCSECGAPWERVVERGALVPDDPKYAGKVQDWKIGDGERNPTARTDTRVADHHHYENRTTGWRPTCKHEAPLKAALVLDPFGGSGTVGQVAKTAGRDYVLIELNPAYVAMAEKRIGSQERLL